MYVLAISLLLVLGLAAALERRVHHALFVLRHGGWEAVGWPPEPRATAAPIPLSPGVAAEHAGLGRPPVGVRVAVAQDEQRVVHPSLEGGRQPEGEQERDGDGVHVHARGSPLDRSRAERMTRT